MSDKKVRGSALSPYLKYVKTKWGVAGLDEFCRDTSIDGKKIKDGEWYEVDVIKRFQKWILEKKGEKQLEEAGKFSIKNLGLLSFVVRFMSIKKLLAQSDQASYRQAYNFGKMESTVEDKRALIRLHDVSLDENSCIVWRGAFKGLLEITKTKGTVREIKCQQKGADYCEFEMEWE